MDYEKRAYDYDLNKMITDFKTEELKQKHYLDSSKRFQAANLRWKKTQEKMKERKEENYENNLEEKLNRLKEKSYNEMEQLKKIKEQRKIKIKELSKLQEERARSIKIKLDSLNKTNEINRLNVKFGIDTNLNKFVQNNKENQDQKRQALQERSQVSLEKFTTNYENIKSVKMIELEKNKQRPIEKYEKWYISHYNKKLDKITDKRKNSADRKNRYYEKTIELEEDMKKKGEKIMLGLEQKTQKKNELDRKISEELHKKGKKMHDKYIDSLNKKELMKKHSINEYNKLLENQVEKLNKAKSIEQFYDEKRSENATKNLIYYMEGESRIMTFYRELDNHKNLSLNKKTFDEKKRLYQDIKRKQEAEKKKKLEMEMKLKQSND